MVLQAHGALEGVLQTEIVNRLRQDKTRGAIAAIVVYVEFVSYVGKAYLANPPGQVEPEVIVALFDSEFSAEGLQALVYFEQFEMRRVMRAVEGCFQGQGLG